MQTSAPGRGETSPALPSPSFTSSVRRHSPQSNRTTKHGPASRDVPAHLLAPALPGIADEPPEEPYVSFDDTHGVLLPAQSDQPLARLAPAVDAPCLRRPILPAAIREAAAVCKLQEAQAALREAWSQGSDRAGAVAEVRLQVANLIVNSFTERPPTDMRGVTDDLLALEPDADKASALQQLVVEIGAQLTEMDERANACATSFREAGGSTAIWVTAEHIRASQRELGRVYLEVCEGLRSQKISGDSYKF